MGDENMGEGLWVKKNQWAKNLIYGPWVKNMWPKKIYIGEVYG